MKKVSLLVQIIAHTLPPIPLISGKVQGLLHKRREELQDSI